MLDDLIYVFDPYEDFPWKESVRDAYADGVRVFSYLYPLVLAWREDGSYDFSVLDDLEDEVLEIAPGSRLLPRLFMTTPDWWDRRHPEELLAFDGPRPLVRKFERSHQKLWKYEDKMYHSTVNASFASKLWRRDGASALQAYLRHFFATRGRERLEAVQIAYGTAGEWGAFGSYTNGQFANGDFSSPMVEAFGRRPPAKRERMRVEYGMLRSPAFARECGEFIECMAREQVESLRCFCRAVKQIDPSLPVGSFGCYVMSPGASCYMLHNLVAARTTPRMLELPELDFVSTPNVYFNRRNGIFSQAPVHSVSRRKIFIAECDVRTSRAGDIYSPSPEDDLSQFLMECGSNLATGSGRLWLYDFGRHWYGKSEVRKAVSRISELCKSLPREIRSGDAAVVIDLASSQCSENGMGFYRHFARTLYGELPRSGVHFDHILFDDIFELKPYRLYVFRDKFLTSEEDAARLRAFLKANDASAVWLGPAGCVTESRVDFTFSEKLTGIAVRPVEESAGSNSVTLLDQPGEWLVDGMTLPYAPCGVEDIDGCHAPLLTGSGGRVMGLVESSGLPGMVLREEGARFDLWSASAFLDRRLIRNLCERAGVRIQVRGPVGVYGSGDIFVVRADDRPCEAEIAAEKVTDLISGERFTAPVRIRLNARESRLLRRE